MSDKHTALPWVVEPNPTIPEGKQVAAFEARGEMAGNRNLQVIIRSNNLDADAELIVKAVNNYDRLREALSSVCFDFFLATGGYHHSGLALLEELSNLEPKQ